MAEKRKAGSRGGDKGNRLERSKEIVRDYFTRRDAGEDVDTDEFLRRYPELEEELRSLFEKIKSRITTSQDLFGKAEERAEPLDDGSKILGDFKIIREIGSGGMATVYEAEQISLKRRVALKVLPSHLSFSDEAVRKFHREAEAGGRQRHPGIVTIHAFGEHEGMHYIAEELVEEGYTMADRLDELREDGELPTGYFREAAKLMAEVADALQHAHAAGVIHRDVKPSNILLTPAGQPKVSDFGLAKIEDALNLSRTGDFAGTPFYMSPEQAMSRRIGIDHRTDVYSLGVTLYETLVLKRPFEGKTSHEVLKKIIFKEPSDPRKLNPRVPRDLAVICLKAMEKEAAYRYQTMEEFAGDLNRFLSGEMIKAQPAPWTIKAWKKIKRHKVVSVACLAASATVLGFVVYAAWSMSEIWQARKEAEVIKDFLLEVLLSPDPDEAGKDVTMLGAVKRAEKEVEEYFADQPEIGASIRNTLGRIFESFGRYEEAEEQFQKELEMYENVMEHDADHEDVLRAKINIACQRLYRKEFAEAEKLLREVLEIARSELGEDHEFTLVCMDNLATAIFEQGRLEEAETLFREVIEIRERNPYEDDVSSSTTLNNLGSAFFKKGEYEKAIGLYTTAYELRRTKLGQEHTATLVVMLNLGSCYRRMKKFGRAEELLQKVMKIGRVKLGDDHRITSSAMKTLGDVYREQGKIELEAELKELIGNNESR